MIVKILEILFIISISFTSFCLGFKFCKYGIDKGWTFSIENNKDG